MQMQWIFFFLGDNKLYLIDDNPSGLTQRVLKEKYGRVRLVCFKGENTVFR